MNIGEIIGDALVYPFHNIKALLIYVILGIIAGLAVGGSIFGIAVAMTNGNGFAAGGSVLGFIVFFIVALLISGYTLDIVKFGIERRADGPGIDIIRQITNAIKLLVVGIVYYIIPAIISWLLTTLLGTGILTLIIVLIVSIVFALAEFMAKCRLAKTDSLGEGLAIGEAIGDISRVGIGKLLATIIITAIIIIIVALIIGFIGNYNATVGGILLGIFGVYAVFFYNRAIGLLYSNA